MHSRRKFLFQMTLIGLLSGGIRALGIEEPTSSLVREQEQPDEIQLLAAVIDAIIPEADGMSSATSAGCVQYLRYLGWQYPSIQQQLTESFHGIEQSARAQYGTKFAGLGAGQRTQILSGIEQQHPSEFAMLIGYVYEAYYTRPRVFGLVSCNSPLIADNYDELLLAPVRNMKHLYREVH